jgi:hypothetical protein
MGNEATIGIDDLFQLVKTDPKFISVEEMVFCNVLESGLIFISAHMVDSDSWRRINCLSELWMDKCPPFVLFSVRSQHSIMNVAPAFTN